HDLVDEDAGHRQVAEQQAVLGGPEEQVEDHVPVHRRRYLAPADGPVQHDPVLGAQRLEHPLPPGPGRRAVRRWRGGSRGPLRRCAAVPAAYPGPRVRLRLRLRAAEYPGSSPGSTLWNSETIRYVSDWYHARHHASQPSCIPVNPNPPRPSSHSSTSPTPGPPPAPPARPDPRRRVHGRPRYYKGTFQRRPRQGLTWAGTPVMSDRSHEAECPEKTDMNRPGPRGPAGSRLA